jgi:hypothetical protein
LEDCHALCGPRRERVPRRDKLGRVLQIMDAVHDTSERFGNLARGGVENLLANLPFNSLFHTWFLVLRFRVCLVNVSCSGS